ncbi:GIY-YIG nuclease family protein [Actinotalea fermentans]|uniref:GIY-YIG catalytic domain-containing protein n=1 Tax=Actinotalea fermentans TaxID=43671 RepID=A0A511YZ83_9CELL|nr:hypothetical protein [Actinotalea fermentans]KGM17333.1 hypothetical protein N867_05715 [Actinotalea fermentans ATCC 43279 = JCM 9966 = DSM 3133]GEN80509.1 hypothetical protein AFE02nite_22430 [Actinotalea fermentans]
MNDPAATSPADAPPPATPDALVAALRDAGAALSPSQLRALDRRSLASPGLYSWWVDERGAADLSRGLGHPLGAGLIYAGQAGASRSRSAKPSTNTLAGRLVGMHLGGRARMSTFRRTLGSILWPGWGGEADEELLTRWMDDHLRVIPVPVPDGATLDALETAVLARLDPPLNLAKMTRTDLRADLTRLRRRYARAR